jgi:hypothetical protein
VERGIRLTGNCEMSGCIAGLAENARKKSARQLWRDIQCESKRLGKVVTLPGMVRRLRASREPDQGRCASRGEAFARLPPMLT